MLDQLLGGAKDTIIRTLTTKLGLDPTQAGGFLQKGLSLLEGGLKSGSVDPSSLTSGNTSGVLSKLDLGQLTGYVGGDTTKARTGMETILNQVTDTVKSRGGAGALMSQLGVGGGGSQGGVMGQVGGMAGKLFGKK